MANRISRTKRIEMRNLAEVEVQKYKHDHALWHKYVHNVTLDPMQILKCIEMDESPNTVDNSCRRTGKTAIKELYCLKKNSTQPDQSLGIVAPREAQSKVNLDYHLDAIRRSQILEAYIDHKGGRRQIADTYYMFANQSRAHCYGIMANVDGGDLTCASLEEVDDMPSDRLYSRFLLMLGSTRRLGAIESSADEPPQIRITGVFKGADTLQGLIDSGLYRQLPLVNVHLGIEMGILHKNFMEDMRKELSSEEYIRQLLCKNVTSRNLIWEKFIRIAMVTGLMADIQLAEPLPGVKYKKRGLISIGYDHTGHGEKPESSKSAVIILEQLGSFTCVIYARTWPPGTDEAVIERDLVELWRYFNPDYGMGDAFGIGLIGHVNDVLFNENLININRQAINDGNSTASSWNEWAFSPVQFQGMQKHSMAVVASQAFRNRQIAIPYFEDFHANDPALSGLVLLVRQLANIRAEETKATYASYKMVNSKVGDDLFDAFIVAYWALYTRGIATIQTVILNSSTTRENMIEKTPALPNAGTG